MHRRSDDTSYAGLRADKASSISFSADRILSVIPRDESKRRPSPTAQQSAAQSQLRGSDGVIRGPGATWCPTSCKIVNKSPSLFRLLWKARPPSKVTICRPSRTYACAWNERISFLNSKFDVRKNLFRNLRKPLQKRVSFA